MDRALNGLYPLSYRGVRPSNPPNLLINKVSPTSDDSQNINIGTLWLVLPLHQDIATEVWMLTKLVGFIATWTQLYPSSSQSVSTFPCDSGTATSVAGVLSIKGDTHNISTSGSGNTVSINLSNGTNGQTLIAGSTAAQWELPTSSTITITPNINALNMDITGTLATSYNTDNGIAVPSAGVLTVHGGDNINTTGSGSTVSIILDTDIIIPGTITIPSLDAGVVQSDSTGLLSSSKGTDGQLLISSPTSALWNTLTSTGATITITNGHNSINLETSGASGSLGAGNFAFLAVQTTNLLNITGDNSLVPLGAFAKLTIIFDVGSNFNGGDALGTPAFFTAPEDGYYHFQMQVSTSNTTNYMNFYIVTPARTYRLVFNGGIISRGGTGNPNKSLSMGFTTIANMNAMEKAYFQVQAANSSSGTGPKNVNILHDLGLSEATLTSVSGFKIG